MANESLLVKEAVKNLTSRTQRTEKANKLVIEWSKSLSENDSWPQGKSLKGFEKWLRTSYRKAQDEARNYTLKTGLTHEAGHGEQGANAPSNLGNQIKKGQYGNRTTNDRVTGEVVKKSTDHLRIKDDLDAADVGYKMEKAFEEYLHEGNPNLKIEDQKQFSAKQREAILHRPDYASTAEGAQMKARKHNLENAFKQAAEEHPIPKSHQKIVDQQMDSVLEGHRSRITTPRSSPKPTVKQQVLGFIKKNGDNGDNGDHTNGSKLKFNGKSKAILGGVLAGGVSLLPSEAGATQIRDEISQGKVGNATKTYAKDLFLGESQSRAFNQSLKVAHSKLGKLFGKKLARQALKIAGRQVMKKVGALATGPAAPAVMTGLLIKDAYDVANALSGGGLESQKVDTSNRKRLRHNRK